eukprot:scaffold115003_cov16-Phaeocystis_antarctica.AAC.1
MRRGGCVREEGAWRGRRWTQLAAEACCGGWLGCRVRAMAKAKARVRARVRARVKVRVRIRGGCVEEGAVVWWT